MITPAHALFNLLVQSRARRPREIWPILVGAVLPDAGLMVFYGYYYWWLHTPQSAIWSIHYYSPAWQAVFDVPHAFPVIGVALIAAYAMRSRWLTVMLTSMALHALADLALHHSDAHRHFFPLSNWRFHSPVSYWDPAHYGHYFLFVELLMAGVATVVLMRRHREPWARATVAVVALTFVGFIAYANLTWASLR